MLGHKRTIWKGLVAIVVMFSSSIICWVENMISMVSAISYRQIYDIRFILFIAAGIGIHRMFTMITKRTKQSGRPDFVIESTNDGRCNDEESGIQYPSMPKRLPSRKQKIQWSEVVRVRVVRNLNKYTIQEKNDCWYSKNEYQQMDQERKRATRLTGIFRIFRKGVLNDIEHNFH